MQFHSKLCVTCHSCENACAVKHSDADSVGEIVERGYHPTPRIRIVEKKGKARMIKCVFCKKPKCVEACPNDAIKQEEDGYVSISAEKCTGCGDCVEACPFGALQMSDENISVKCDLCLDEEIPACVSACPVDALTVEE